MTKDLNHERDGLNVDYAGDGRRSMKRERATDRGRPGPLRPRRVLEEELEGDPNGGEKGVEKRGKRGAMDTGQGEKTRRKIGLVSKKLPIKKKEVDDVLGGEDAWKNVDKTDVTCPKCTYGQAFFMQIQIRSADEPMSTFYKCCNMQCQFRWREG
ncbi:hypothetical protein CBR_g31408 [Chara braunii]|uniref:DNA-directed RNA polymerase III subunit RPC10 n=1 Tax=Chara braunii TaxID=69332 RepID=A0A388LF57_CHABU|nr:hypothetical protein CBR_g31408 [Chara braunii]|eukprot:GBG80853.1 hypothetical protein CBR_g31408 [Chara braunii]